VSSLPKFRKSNSSFNHLVKNFIFGQGGDANCVLPNGLPGLSKLNLVRVGGWVYRVRVWQNTPHSGTSKQARDHPLGCDAVRSVSAFVT
jgi:hypothetical protein